MTIKTHKVEKLPPEEHARYKCNDCNDNVLDVGDWYLANPDIWRGLGLEWDDNLCIPCLRKRLGRPFRKGDVFPAQNYVWASVSRRACAAMGIDIDALIRRDDEREARKRKANKRRRQRWRSCHSAKPT